ARGGGGAPPQLEKSWPPPDVVNALIGAAADPEAIVRITAVRTLGLLREPRLVPILAARLTDSARVVRVSAAESLFNMGVIQLEGIPGSVLARVQDEWSDGLRTFNDDAADHVTLGWLEASRGRTADGEKELRTGTQLDPSNARAHVFLGVLAARAGRFDEALQRFKTAKAASPSYPNIDRLIDEAQKRR
ncbi:MAG TPA: HEAT repeat domain-containing protein, partial [Vicinamibacterales bacterium]